MTARNAPHVCFRPPRIDDDWPIMLSNALTRQVGLKVGPIVLETLVKHYFERIRKDAQLGTKLRQDELLYDEAFNIIKVCKTAVCVRIY